MGAVANFLRERLENRINELFDKQKLEDEFQGYGSKDTLRISEFTFNFLQELMITYAFQNKLIQDNQLPKDRTEWSDEQKKKEALHKQRFVAAELKIKNLTLMFFESMISLGTAMHSTLEFFGKKLYNVNFAAAWSFEEKELFFKHVEFILFGKTSPLRSILQFTM